MINNKLHDAQDSKVEILKLGDLAIIKAFHL